jgi:hypothetical protein
VVEKKAHTNRFHGAGGTFRHHNLLPQANKADQRISLGVMLGVYTAGVSTALVPRILGLPN